VQIEQLSVRDWEVLRLSDDAVSLDVVPALGGTVTALRRRSDDASLLWTTPWGLRRRGAWSLPGSSEAQMVDTYPGGWQTLFPNGGDTAVVGGVEWGYHGEARLTWLDWESDDESLVLTGRLVRSPFTLRKSFRLAGDEVVLDETVHNVGGEPVELMWGSQLALGGDLIGPGSSVQTSASTVHPDPRFSISNSYEDLMPWPRSQGNRGVVNLSRVPGPDADETHLAYLADFATPSLTVRSPDRRLGLDLHWEESWPYLWYSMETGGRHGFPWYSRGYFLALTPSTGWPAHGLHEVRRASATTIWLQPDEERSIRLRLRVHPEPAR
jgi:hypothetical protein